MTKRLGARIYRWLGVLLFAVAACSGGPPTATGDRVGSTTEALNTSPKIGNFVVYAQRSVKLGASTRTSGGDVGVRAVATSGFGAQLIVGASSSLDAAHNLLAPSVTLGLLSAVGDVQTSQLQNNGGTLHTLAAFPAAAMPPLPIAPTTTAAGSSVTVPAFTILTLNPGHYGALSVTGTLSLNPGAYSFSSATLANSAHVWANTGGVTVQIAGTLSAGTSATVSVLPGQTADQLNIAVGGADGATGSPPAASFGAGSLIVALVAVPHGTLALGDNITAAGAFAGFDVTTGNSDNFTLQTGFPNAPVAGQQQLSGYVTPAIAAAPLVGPVPSSTVLTVALGLPVQTPTGKPTLTALAQQVSDPTNAAYRQFITPATFATQYAPTGADYQTLMTFATSNGLSLTSTYSNHLLLDVSGTAAQLEQALSVGLDYYLRPDGTQFYAPDRDPSVNLSLPLLRISGLEDYVPPQPASTNGSGPNGAYVSHDYRSAYASCTTATGATQRIGIFSFSGFVQTDIGGFATPAGLPNAPSFTVQPVDGFPTTTMVQGQAGEVTLDVEMALSMAPQASVVVFEGAYPNTNAILNAMATTTPLVNEMSSSFQMAYDANTLQILNEFAVQGQSFFTASGDDGAYQAAVTDLRGAPGVTVVGGTSLSMTANGGAYQSESVWTGSGGGVLSGTLIPSYQAAAPSLAANGGSTSFRNLPDVAMVSDNDYDFITSFGTMTPVGGPGTGTSFASPLWAGYMALANQLSGINGQSPVGFANPVLYDIAESSAASYAGSYNDVTTGNSGLYSGGTLSGGTLINASGGFAAKTGYDLATGLGSPACGLLMRLSNSRPVDLAPPIPVAVAGGAHFTCGLRLGGAVDCWGTNFRGQIGNPSITISAETPVPVLLANGQPLGGAIAIATGMTHACALLSGQSVPGNVWCWGDNSAGQLGNGTTGNLPPATASIPGPVQLNGAALAGAIAVTAGDFHTCALRTDGTVWCWGSDQVSNYGSLPVQVTLPTSAVAISAGDTHTCAALADGHAWCWGQNSFGELGDGTTTSRTTPVAVTDPSGALLTSVFAVGSGENHTCVLERQSPGLAYGQVWCWGRNTDGELANGTTTQRSTGVPISGQTVNALSIVSGGHHSCTANVDGSMSCWGDNAQGQAGIGSLTDPQAVVTTKLSGVLSVTAGLDHTCAVVGAGTVWCWGLNDEGQLGLGPNVGSQSLPQQVTF
jgi:alpha-tubulin suppressor-like RCC1 family protein